jgi:hypothetical protein
MNFVLRGPSSCEDNLYGRIVSDRDLIGFIDLLDTGESPNIIMSRGILAAFFC